MLNTPSAVIAVLAVVLAINGFLYFEYYLPRTTLPPARTEHATSPTTTAEQTRPTRSVERTRPGTTLEGTTTSTATSAATTSPTSSPQ